MKGEIFRRMSMEINKNEGVRTDNTSKTDEENDKSEDEDDYLVKTIGPFGLWQAVVSVTVLLTRVVAMWNAMSLVFLTPKIEFICVEFSDNVTEVNNSTCYDNCLKYNYTSVIGRTVIEDFALICENAWLASFTNSVLMLGLLIGTSLFGWISDRFGRRTTLLVSTFINAVFMIALPFSPDYIIFTSIRFVIGVATGGSLATGVVQIMEIVGKRQREIAGGCVMIPDSLALLSLTGLAYLTSNWQAYTLSYGILTGFIFVLMLFVPESPRWYMSHGKIDEAVKVITRAANRNKFDTLNIKTELTKALEDMKLKEHENVKTTYLDFFKSKAIFIQTSALFVLWLAVGACFYGIYQYVTIIGVDPYLTVVIIGLLQATACPVSIILNKKFGRKSSILILTSSIAILMLIVIFIPKGYWLATLLGTVAFIFCNILFSIAYVHISELYPTPLRNMSYGLTSSGAKIGAMIAPFIANLSPIWLPSLMFCIFPIVGGLCALTLPETKGRNLKDTIEK